MSLALSGTGLSNPPGSGSVSAAMALSGVGGVSQAGTGSVALSMALGGTGSVSQSGTGSVSASMALSGTGGVSIAGTGSTSMTMTLSGTGSTGGVLTLFSQAATGSSIVSDPADYTLGVQFSVSATSTLNAIWFYSPTGATTLPATIGLYAVSGTSLVHSEVASWSGSAGSGWVRAAFVSPPSLTASTNYKGSITSNTLGTNWYSDTSHYWDTGAGGSGITNGKLSAPNNAGGSGGQDTFHQSVTPAYPGSSFNATNYWLDIEVQ